jgi:hypothetical protein
LVSSVAQSAEDVPSLVESTPAQNLDSVEWNIDQMYPI